MFVAVGSALALALTGLVVLPGLTGCQNDGGGGGGGFRLFGGSDQQQELWTILCVRTTGPDHAEWAAQLADLLRQSGGLDAQKVRVESTADSSAVYYGTYRKVMSRETGDLEFPQDYRQDIARIRQLHVGGQQLFSLPTPELIEGASPTMAGMEMWNVHHAPGPYTLQIGIFYNTPTFHQRRDAAEQYVRLLRDEGFIAYFYHEDVRSFVFVGDFDESDVEQTPEGPRFGPRVERLIAQREDEFRYVLENGHRVRHRGPAGQMNLPRSMLIRVPD